MMKLMTPRMSMAALAAGICSLAFAAEAGAQLTIAAPDDVAAVPADA